MKNIGKLTFIKKYQPKYINLWKNQYNLFINPNRIGSHGKIYNILDHKDKICKVIKIIHIM